MTEKGSTSGFLSQSPDGAPLSETDTREPERLLLGACVITVRASPALTRSLSLLLSETSTFSQPCLPQGSLSGSWLFFSLCRLRTPADESECCELNKGLTEGWGGGGGGGSPQHF